MRFSDAYDPIRALKSSWKLLTPSALPLLVGGVILFLTDGQGGANFKGRLDHALDAGAILALVGLFGCITLVCFLISSWISAGMANAVEKTVLAGSAELGDVFESRGRFLDMILVRLLLALIVIATVVPLALIGGGAFLAHEAAELPTAAVVGGGILLALLYLPVLVYVWLGVSLSRMAVAFEGMGPTAAIGRSWSLAKGNRLTLLVYWIVLFVFTLLGFCLCCVGVLLTGSLSIIAANESYLALVKPDEYSRSWLAAGRMPSGVAYPPPSAPGSASGPITNTNSGDAPPPVPPAPPNPWSS